MKWKYLPSLSAHQWVSEVCFHSRTSVTKLQLWLLEHRCSNGNALASAPRWVSRSRNLFVTSLFLHLPAVVTVGCSAEHLRCHRVQMAQLSRDITKGAAYKPHTPLQCPENLQPSPGAGPAAVPPAKLPKRLHLHPEWSPVRDALGIRDVTILSACEPKIHRPALLKQSYCQGKDETVKQKAACDGRNEVTAPGTEKVYCSLQTFLIPKTGQTRRFFSVLLFCPTFLHTGCL